MRDWKWSQSEKAIARKVFDSALQAELEATIRQAKERAARIREASDLWKLEDWLSKRRREIDERYDYRYSVLPLVFAGLLRDGLITRGQLDGLQPEKLAAIRVRSEI